MRNLKRVLSLVLAAFMLIGMMVVGAGAVSYSEFTDHEDIVNKDAVSMLTTLGVIDGMTDGSFDPSGPVTREQMAKMISIIMNQGADINDQYANLSSGLTDVAGNWAIGHINYCYTLGIIAGRGDNTFCPKDNVTAVEAAKMLLVAAGYKPDLEGFVGASWDTNTAAMASKLGIFKNYTGSITAELSRDDAVLLIYNALDIEMIQKYEDGYAINYDDSRTILAAMYGVYKMEGVVVANEWARLEKTDSDDALQTGKTRLTDIKVYESNTQSTVTGDSGVSYRDDTFNVTTPVEYIGKPVTMYIKKTTVLANSTILGVVLKEDTGTHAGVATVETAKDFLKNTGVTVDKDTEYYVNYGVMTAEESEAWINNWDKGRSGIDTNGDGKDEPQFNLNGISIEVIDNDDDGIAEYVLYRQDTLSKINRFNDRDETISFYEPIRNKDNELSTGTNGATTKTATLDFDECVYVDDKAAVPSYAGYEALADSELATEDLILYITYGGRTYISLAPIVTDVMTRVDRDKNNELYVTIGGEEYRQSYILDTASLVDVDIEHFVIEDAQKEIGFTAEYDFILDATEQYIVAYRPTEVVTKQYALVLASAWTQNALDIEGQIKIYTSEGDELTKKLNWDASAKAFKNTNITGADNDEKLKNFLGTRDVVTGDDNSTASTFTKLNNGVGAIIEYTYSESTDKITINRVLQGNALTNTTNLEINNNWSDTDSYKSIEKYAGVGDNGDIVYMGRTPDTLQYTGSYTNGRGSITVKGVNETNDTANGVPNTTGSNVDRHAQSRSYAVDRDTIAFYWDSSKINNDGSAKSGGYGVAVGWDEMGTTPTDLNPDGTVGVQVYPVLTKVAKNEYKASDLAEVILFECMPLNDSNDYLLVLSRNASERNKTELNVVLEDGTALTVELAGNAFDVDNSSHFMKAWSYTIDNDGKYRLISMYQTNVPDFAQLDCTAGYAQRLTRDSIEMYTGTAMTKSQLVGYLSLPSTAGVWDVTGAKNSGSKIVSGVFDYNHLVNAVVIVKNTAAGGEVRTAWIWDLPNTPEAGPVDLTYGNVVEYDSFKLLVQYWSDSDKAPAGYQIAELIREKLQEENSHVESVTLNGGKATVSYDNTVVTTVYDITLDRVYAYEVILNGNATLKINGVTYRNGSYAYLGSIDPTDTSGTKTTNDFDADGGRIFATNVYDCDNDYDTITVKHDGSSGDGKICVWASGVTPTIADAITDALAGGGSVEVTGVIPANEEPVHAGGNTYDTVIDVIDGNGAATGTLTLKGASVGENQTVLINGEAEVDGTLTIPSTGTLEVVQLTLGADDTLNLAAGATLNIGGLTVTEGSKIVIGNNTYVAIDDMFIDTINEAAGKFVLVDGGHGVNWEVGSSATGGNNSVDWSNVPNTLEGLLEAASNQKRLDVHGAELARNLFTKNP